MGTLRVYEMWLIVAIRDVSPPFSAAIQYCESLQIDSEGRIIDVLLGSFLTMREERAIIKLGLQTGAGS